MKSQLRDQWDAMMTASGSGDASTKARLMVQTARLLMEEAASVAVPGLPLDLASKRLLGEWSQAARGVADYLGSTVKTLDPSLDSFKVETNVRLAQLKNHTDSLEITRLEYERMVEECKGLQCREDELRKTADTLESLLVCYRELKAINEKVSHALPKLADDQEALSGLWSALGSASKQLETQRNLFVAGLGDTSSIVDPLALECKLFAQAPGPALEQAILAVADARSAVERLTRQIYAARQEQQHAQEVMMRLAN